MANPDDVARAMSGEKDLHGADLSGASLLGADLSDANLYGANLSGARPGKANLLGANLSGANLDAAEMWQIFYDANTIWPWPDRIPAGTILLAVRKPIED
jgi:uncharacterized protein YjbI with pentapeptide repeats